MTTDVQKEGIKGKGTLGWIQRVWVILKLLSISVAEGEWKCAMHFIKIYFQNLYY